MSNNSSVNLNLNLPFAAAEVAFNISVEANGDGPSTFGLNATDLSSNNALPFTVNVSPCLADWVRGYSRWLVRAGVTATHDTESISGTFRDGMTAEQILLGMREACYMIRQRFELYEESVIL